MLPWTFKTPMDIEILVGL